MKQRTRILSIAAFALVLTGGGVTYAIAQGGDDTTPVTESERRQAGDAALAETGGGTVTDVEHDDGGYDVDVRLTDGSEIDVDLDGDLGVVRSETDRPDATDDDDLPLDDADRQRAADAALAETGDGTVTDVDRDDDGGYDVEVRLAHGPVIDVDLDADFAVVRTEVDGPDATDDDDLPVGDADRQRAAEAARAETGGGTVTDVERDDDGGFDVEVRLDNGSEVDVDLDGEFTVVRTEGDH